MGKKQEQTKPEETEQDNIEYSSEEQIEEFNHFRNIVSSYLNYRQDSYQDIKHIYNGLANIGENIKYLKPDFNNRIKKIEQAIQLNASFLDKIVEQHKDIAYLIDPHTNQQTNPSQFVLKRDVSKLRTTLKQMIRDWSIEGQQERDNCYKPVLEEFKKHFPQNFDQNNQRIRVLFPGCGLGRIVFDFAALGYGAQGNEFSYHMLFASNYILNNTKQENEIQIQPYIHQLQNNLNESEAFKVYSIPDINPNSCMDPTNNDFSMTAGEFVEIYKKQKAEWNCVCTIFFIDTANDIIEYIKTIYNCLKKGGVWINLGPLLYHYADQLNENSIELSWDEIKHVIVEIGFELVVHENIQTQYAQNPYESMVKIEYDCVFFTAYKK